MRAIVRQGRRQQATTDGRDYLLIVNGNQGRARLRFLSIRG